MQGKLAGFGILSLFLIMLVPVYGEVTEFSIEKKFYTIDEGIVFVGNTDEERELVSYNSKSKWKRKSPNRNSVKLQGIFETIPKSVDNFFQLLECMS